LHTTRQLVIDGDEVTFAIKLSGQAMAVPEGGRIDSGKPFLGATARRDGEEVWSGVLPSAVDFLTPINAQFADAELERLYREARFGRSTQG